MTSTSPDSSLAVQTVMQALPYTAADIQTAVQTYTGLDATAQNEMYNAATTLAKGGLNIGTVSSILGTALTTVNPALGAVYAAGVSIVDGLAQLANGDQHYEWYTGVIGHNPPRPYGPGAPGWTPYALAVVLAKGVTSSIGKGLDDVVPGLRDIDSQNETSSPPQAAFATLYKHLWELNFEMLWNGHTWAEPYALLEVAVNHWNATHAPTSRFTFTGKGSDYIDKLIAGAYIEAGVYSGQNNSTITINTGAVVAPTPKATPMTVNINPLTFGKGTGSPSTNRGILEAALYWATGTSYAGQSTAAIDAAIASLRATGISEAKFNSLTHAGQVIMNEAQIPVVMNVGGVFRPVAAPAPAASGGISSGVIALGVLGVAGAVAAWKFYQNRQGI